MENNGVATSGIKVVHVAQTDFSSSGTLNVFTLLFGINPLTHSLTLPYLPLRPSTQQRTQTAPLLAVSLSNTTKRVSSRGTSSTCRSTMLWPFSGVSISSLPWGSARWRAPLPPTTGPLPNQLISPCSPCLVPLYAHSGRFLIHSAV